jgi:hypothetical protein
MPGVRLDACGTGVCGRGYCACLQAPTGRDNFLRRGYSGRDFVFTYRVFWITLQTTDNINRQTFLEIRFDNSRHCSCAGLAGDINESLVRPDGNITELNKRAEKLTLYVVFMVQIVLCQGCNVLGFLASPGPFEQKLPPQCEIKKVTSGKILVWVEALPGSGASAEVTEKLHQALKTRLTKKAGISKKDLLTMDPLFTSAYNPSQKPEEIGRKAGAGSVLYVRLEEYDIVSLHSNTIFSGQMKARAFLIRSENGEVVCPEDPAGILADVGTETTAKGREEVLQVIADAAAHCIVRSFYPCPKYEYQINEERSIMNEMIRQEVY